MHYIAICIYKNYNDFIGDDIADTSNDKHVSKISSKRNLGVKSLSVETWRVECCNFGIICLFVGKMRSNKCQEQMRRQHTTSKL